MSQSSGKVVRFLLASTGMDAHSVGPRLFASGLIDAGIEVIFLGVKQTIAKVVETTMQEDPDVIGLSLFSGIHMEAVQELKAELKKVGMGDIPILVGGTIPPQDIPKLIELGAANAWEPGTPIDRIVDFVYDLVDGAVKPPEAEKTADEDASDEPVWETEDAKIPLQVYYTAEDIKDLNLEETLGVPGEFPHTRALYESSYRDHMWQVRQYSGLGKAEDTAKRAKYIAAQGTKGRGGVTVINIILDQPSQQGYDSDSPQAVLDAGRVGVAIDTMEDMDKVFKDLELARVFFTYPTYTSSPFWAMYCGLARQRGTPQEYLRGSTINAAFEPHICSSSAGMHPKDQLRLGLDLMEYTSKTSKYFTSITMSANNIRESGATNLQSVAWAVAEGIAYSQGLVSRGVDIDQFASKFSFYCATERDFFEEICKYRALRKVWAREMKERFNPQNKRSTMARITCRTIGSMLTAQQPLMNISRTTVQALASVLGGVQSLTVTPYDEALSIPSRDAMTMALRQHEILASETNLRAVSDPLGGSYFVEKLTSQYEEKIKEELDKIEAMGEGEEFGPAMTTGLIKGIESGYFVNANEDASFARQKDIISGKRVMLGVNKSRIEDDEPIAIEPPDGRIAKIKADQLREYKAGRDMAPITEALDKLFKTAQTSENIMEPMIEAFMAGATLEEVYHDTLMRAFGRWKGQTRRTGT